MKILFVWPNKDQFGFKPMSLALLSSILKQKGHDVDLFDTTFMDLGFKDNTEVSTKIKMFKKVDFTGHDVTKKKVNLEKELTKKLDEFEPDIVAISALSSEMYVGFKLSEIAKKWNSETPVVWGNKAATMSFEKVLDCKDIDFLCIGEGIEFMAEFVECIAHREDPRTIRNIAYREDSGKVQKKKLRPYYQELDSLPPVDWSIFDKRQFLKPFSGKLHRGGDHMTCWGCPNQCTYCINVPYRKLYGIESGRFLRRYSVDRIINELKFLVDEWRLDFLKFHDEDFCLKPTKYFQDLAEKYQRHVGIPFTIMANAHNVTEEKVALLKKMNCVSVSLGIETGNHRLRKEMLKRNESEGEIIEATRMLNDAGIRTSSFNMLGIPFESRKTVMETVELNREAGVRYPYANFYFPLEGTELRKIAAENGFFDASSGAVFQHEQPALVLPNISSEELIALRDRFALYVKMPRAFFEYIERSEKSDEVSKKLTDELYRIYDECVLANEGIWDDCGKKEKYLECLKNLLTR